jgi:hypothetical protein
MELDLDALELLGEERGLTGDGCDNNTCQYVTLCDPPPTVLA